MEDQKHSIYTNISETAYLELMKVAQKRVNRTITPGADYIPVTGKVLDEEDLLWGVDAVMDGWLTTGRFNTLFEKDLAKAKRINPQMAEFSVTLSYLETLLDLPWDDITEDNFDLKKVKKILDQDHFGLQDVKERIIEHLAVLKLKGDMKAPIICLVGPPGVGKTSLGKSIGSALKRNFIRSLVKWTREK